jgi:hypothetical protein
MRRRPDCSLKLDRSCLLGFLEALTDDYCAIWDIFTEWDLLHVFCGSDPLRLVGFIGLWMLRLIFLFLSICGFNFVEIRCYACRVVFAPMRLLLIAEDRDDPPTVGSLIQRYA